jgi:hypothetical protein
MPFLKLNQCQSTQVAINVFHAFRSNSVNLVEKPNQSRDAEDPEYFQYEPEDEWLRTEEDGHRWCDNDRLEYISRLLQDDCYEVRIHDIVSETGPSNESDRRLVEFFVRMQRPPFTKVKFSILVSRFYAEWDDDQGGGSGWTAWKPKRMELVFIDPVSAEQDRPSNIKMRVVGPFSSNEKPHHFTKKDFDGLVTFCR